MTERPDGFICNLRGGFNVVTCEVSPASIYEVQLPTKFYAAITFRSCGPRMQKRLRVGFEVDHKVFVQHGLALGGFYVFKARDHSLRLSLIP